MLGALHKNVHVCAVFEAVPFFVIHTLQAKACDHFQMRGTTTCVLHRARAKIHLKLCVVCVSTLQAMYYLSGNGRVLHYNCGATVHLHVVANKKFSRALPKPSSCSI
jgi:hypothetical protein